MKRRQILKAIPFVGAGIAIGAKPALASKQEQVEYHIEQIKCIIGKDAYEWRSSIQLDRQTLPIMLAAFTREDAV